MASTKIRRLKVESLSGRVLPVLHTHREEQNLQGKTNLALLCTHRHRAVFFSFDPIEAKLINGISIFFDS